MEDRMMKFYSKESNMLALHAMHGHFATSHSHINYYVDVTSIKTRVAEAKQAAHVLYSRIPKTKYVDTIVCMDGTEVVGTFLTEEIQNGGIMGTTNQHETVYVISPRSTATTRCCSVTITRVRSKESMWCFFWQLRQPARPSAEHSSVSSITEERLSGSLRCLEQSIQ